MSNDKDFLKEIKKKQKETLNLALKKLEINEESKLDSEELSNIVKETEMFLQSLNS